MDKKCKWICGIFGGRGEGKVKREGLGRFGAGTFRRELIKQ